MPKLHSRPLRTSTIAAAATLALVLGPAGASLADLVSGGGPAKADCYIEFDVAGLTSATVKNNKVVTCQDGAACDADGTANGTCDFKVALCPNQTNVAGCTSVPPLTLKGKSLPILQPPADLSGSTCGAASDVMVALKKNGKKPGHTTLHVTAKGGGKPKTDRDNVKLVCTPGVPCPNPPCGVQCRANPAGGPDRIDLSTADSGSDLDNGWTGISHNFPTPPKSSLSLCLSGCDASTNPMCDATGPTGPGSMNGLTFGPPLPLIAQSVPVCVINRYQHDPSGKFNIQTGEVPADSPLMVDLFSDVYLTVPTAVCPRCAGGGNTIGASGTCDSGQNRGRSCTVDSVVNVVQAEGSPVYALSKSCPPEGATDSGPRGGQIAGTLDIKLRLTTGTSTLSGSKPCTAANTGGVTGVAVQDDNCHGSACSASCSGAACVKMVPDPVTGNPVCQDSKGGISQLCCASSAVTPCFPSSAASGGAITRMGHADPPAPVWPDTTYPKTSSKGVLVTTFCEGATSASTINATAGLPGPGALILPGTQTVTKITP